MKPCLLHINAVEREKGLCCFATHAILSMSDQFKREQAAEDSRTPLPPPLFVCLGIYDLALGWKASAPLLLHICIYVK